MWRLIFEFVFRLFHPSIIDNQAFHTHSCQTTLVPHPTSHPTTKSISRHSVGQRRIAVHHTCVPAPHPSQSVASFKLLVGLVYFSLKYPKRKSKNYESTILKKTSDYKKRLHTRHAPIFTSVMLKPGHKTCRNLHITIMKIEHGKTYAYTSLKTSRMLQTHY